MRPFAGLAALAVWIALAGCSCGDDSSTDGGDGAGAAGPGSGGPTTTGPGPASSGTGLASSSSGGGIGNLGAPCRSDADCGVSLECVGAGEVTDPVLGGGPAGGYCTKACMSDEDCPDGGSACIPDSRGGYCFLGCELGPPGPPFELDPDKCHGRDDVRCQELESGATVCLPTCGADYQCLEARCEPGPFLNLCTETLGTGAPLGAVCDQDVDPDPCSGFCIRIVGADTETLGQFCTANCVQGGFADDCGGFDDSTTPPTLKGLCAFTPSATETGPGDVGFCTNACMAQVDCQTPLLFCFGLPNTGTDIINGFCFTAADCDAAGAECLDAEAMPTGTTCVDIDPTDAFVGKCLDPDYPLQGSTGAGGAGTGGAGEGGGG